MQQRKAKADVNIAILGASEVDAAELLEQLQARFDGPGHCVLSLASSQKLLSKPQDPHDLDGFNLVLLMGVQANGSPELHQADHALRVALNQSAVPYALVHGTGLARVDNALQAIQHALGTPRANTTTSRWKWPCEKCSDPQCEHRLFSELLKTS